MGNTKIRICKKCSGLDIDQLKNEYGEESVSKGCIGKCRHRSPELRGTFYGYINNEFEIALSERDFLRKISESGITKKI